MLQARGVIPHNILLAGEEKGLVAVSVKALMSTGEVAEVRGGAFIGDCTFPEARESRRVVGAVSDGGVADVMRVGHKSRLGSESRLLQVTIRDSSSRVVERDQVPLDVLRERKSPDKGFSLMVEEDSAHAHLGSISRSQEGRFLRDDLG